MKARYFIFIILRRVVIYLLFFDERYLLNFLLFLLEFFLLLKFKALSFLRFYFQGFGFVFLLLLFDDFDTANLVYRVVWL
jgi:hypothetical protein